jgi:hypothetical protein
MVMGFSKKFKKLEVLSQTRRGMGDFRVGHMINFFDFSQLPIMPQDSELAF